MKTVVIAGLDNMTFTAADLLNPKELKLTGFATAMEQAWNIYDENGNIKDNIEDMPVMPPEVAIACEPNCIILAAASPEDNEALKYMLYRANYRGEVISLFEIFNDFSLKTSVLRKLSWRLEQLGIEGAAADLGAYRGDISWQMNALMPQRKLYLFDTFSGYDPRDTAKEQEYNLSDAKAGQFGLTQKESENIEQTLLERMPYPENVVIKKGWFPETAFDLESEKYAIVHIDTGLYGPTYSGLQYFFPRMSKGGVIIVSGYENGKSLSVRQAVDDLEVKYGAFLITPLGDPEGTVVITCP